MPNFLDHMTIDTTSDSTEPYIYRYHSENRPSVYFCCSLKEGLEGKEDDWQHLLYMGVELEFDSATWPTYSRDNKIQTIREVNEIFGGNHYGYFMLDGSIRRGLEFITQPSTYDFYLENREKFEQVFECIKSHGFGADDYSTTGFHVHFNRDYINYDELETVLYIVNRYWPELVFFSRRAYPYIEHWADKYWNSPQTIVKNMKQGHIPMMLNGRPDRYHAVNVCNTTTIEFRMFHGTLDSQTFFSTLNLISNIVNLAKTHTKEEIKKLPFEFLLTTKEAQEYYHRVSAATSQRKYKNYAGSMVRNDHIPQKQQ